MRIGIIGLGYVGLPLAVEFAELGHDVVGVDTNHGRIDAVNEGVSYVEDIPSERLAAVSGQLCATERYAKLSKVDAIVIAVPTPLTRNREPDLAALVAVGSALANVIQEDQ